MVSAAVCLSSLAAVPVTAADTDIIAGVVSERVGDTITGKCGSYVSWKLENSKLTIAGRGEMTDYGASNNLPWYEYRNSITSVEIVSGVTNIGACAFGSLKKIKTINIPSTVDHIGKSAFEHCEGLEKVDVPSSVQWIGSMAFCNCSSLKEIYIRNPECGLVGNETVICNYNDARTTTFSGTIYGESGSEAEKYAKNYGKNFRVIGSEPQTTVTTTVTTTTTTTTTATTTTTPPVNLEYKPGDVNGDNLIDAVDASKVLAEYAKISSGSAGSFIDKQKAAADVDGNGLVDAVDASKILMYYAYASSGSGEKQTLSDFLKGKKS